ncbi:MAG: hypothetical protein JWQ35_1298, partial [Bacteriovoracaceae bacterium]|nr:hypothetical protein [Bacteriovoracaceae bacterium]
MRFILILTFIFLVGFFRMAELAATESEKKSDTEIYTYIIENAANQQLRNDALSSLDVVSKEKETTCFILNISVEDNDKDLRRHAFTLLSNRKDFVIDPSVLESYLQESDATLRLEKMFFLADRNEIGVIPSLLKEIAKTDFEKNQGKQLLEVLGKLKAKEVCDFASRALSLPPDNNSTDSPAREELRATAVGTLAQASCLNADRLIIQAGNTTAPSEATLHIAIDQTLGKLKTREDIDYLRDRVKSNHHVSCTRQWTIMSLGDTGDASVASDILKGIEMDQNSGARRAAADAFVKLNAKEALSTLSDIINDHWTELAGW